MQQRNNPNNYAYPSYYGFYYPSPYYNRPSSSDKQGDIVLELIDQKQHQLVWQGYASGVLDTSTAHRQEEIRDAVTLIFAEYGRRAGQSGPKENR